METRRIGSLEVSVVGLGCNNFGMRIGEADSARVVHAALDAGITFFDTADIYGSTQSEVFLGRALAGRRDSAVIATKFGMKIDAGREGARPDYVRRAAEDSLRRLGTDRIDLYQLHQPDPAVPIADTLGALEDLVRAGKVREIGCSNFSAAQLRDARAACEPGAAQFVSVQNELSLLEREAERDVLPECGRLGIKFLPYFPLASGLLTGKYRRGEPAPEQTRLSQGWAKRFLTDDRLAIVDALTKFARSHNRSVLDLAVSWLASRPIVASVIAGATSADQVRANAGAAGWQLTEADRTEVDGITAPPPSPA